MDKKIMKVELTVEDKSGEYQYAELSLPASRGHIEKTLRSMGVACGQHTDISVLHAPLVPELQSMRFDTASLAEMNFLAKRLSELDDVELTVHRAIVKSMYDGSYESEIISLRDLINMTYGLGSVTVASNISSDEQLGQFVIENDLREDVALVPDGALHLLDRKKIGEMQRIGDDGVYVNGCYVVAGDYRTPDVYDGKNFPSEEASGKPSFGEETFDVVEVLEHTALFSNGRLSFEDIPNGLYLCDLREGDGVAFAAVEPYVVVNHAGTLITKEPIDFGEKLYIELEDDTAPNFLGIDMTIDEFMNTDFTQTDDETEKIGGMQI